MRPKCPVCGKLFWCDYPHLWRYKRDKKFICSWSCLRKYDGKEAEDMAYSKIKKDGTPAKIPSGKKKEEPKVDLVYEPAIAEEYKAEQEQKKATERTCRILGQEPLDCAAVFSRILKYGRYWKLKDPLRAGFMQLTANDVDITLTANEWIRFSAEILLALEQLGIKEGDPEDYTGNNGPL